jgi:uncharacterized Zn finger protein
VKRGKVTAKVTGSRPRPYTIEIELAQLGDAAWRQAISGMAEKAQFSAELLSGQMPEEIDEVFRAAGASLFPKQRADLVTSCSCPDWGDPCKHVAATHYVLGEALDRDPFLLFELRGRTRDQVLDALRAARGGDAEGSPRSQAKTSAAKTGAAKTGAAKTGAAKTGAAKTGAAKAVTAEVVAHAVPKVALGELTPADYDRPREALPSLRFSFDEPVIHGAVLRQLGVPAAWAGEATPADILAPLVRAAAETARRIAMAEPRGPDDGAAGAGGAEAIGAKAAPAGPRTRRTAARRRGT